MATEITMQQLVEALLDAQNRCNNLLGAMLNQMQAEHQARAAQQSNLNRWKANNPELSARVGEANEKFNTILEAYLEIVLDGLDEVEDTNEFAVREFVDKYAQGFLQLSGLVQTMGQLSS